jgi:PadR family transcriptional regulator PadR
MADVFIQPDMGIHHLFSGLVQFLRSFVNTVGCTARGQVMTKVLVLQDTLLYYVSVIPRVSKPEDSRWESQLRKGSLNLAILAILWDRRCYGLEIIRELKTVGGMELAEGTLYPVLLRLTQEALVESEWVDADSGHPRKYYRLSQAGRRRAMEMMHAWDGFSAAMSRLTEPIKETANDRKDRRAQSRAHETR